MICTNSFPLAIQLIESGKVNLKPLVTHKFPIESALDAFKTMKNPDAGSIKIMIQY